MTFFWTTDLGEFFLPGLDVNGVLPLALACLVAGVLSIVYEGIKVNYHLHFKRKVDAFIGIPFLQVHSATVRARAVREQIAAVSCAPSETNLLVTDQNNSKTSFSDRLCKLCNEAVVFLFHNSIGYIIMLSCMVYSGWLFIAVVLGMGLGYFMFGHISMKINMENVQARTNTVMCLPACAETGESGDGEFNAEIYCMPGFLTHTFLFCVARTLHSQQKSIVMSKHLGTGGESAAITSSTSCIVPSVPGETNCSGCET